MPDNIDESKTYFIHRLRLTFFPARPEILREHNANLPTDMRLLNFFTALTTILTLALFSGCSEKSVIENKLKSYLTEVQQVCGTITNQVAYEPTIRAYPNRRDTRLEVQDIRIGFTDFFSLHTCDMQSLIAERNSALGKIMPVSQQMIYEHRFLVKSSYCQSLLEKEEGRKKKLHKKIEKIIAIKKTSLPKTYWNATFSSPEFEKMFALAPFPLDEKDLDTFDHHINDSLIYLIDIQKKLGSSELTINGQELEDQFYHLQKRKAGGEILKSLDMLTSYLNQVSDALDTRISHHSLCPDGQPNQEANRLFDIFRSHYAGAIEPYIVKLNGKAEKFLTLINRMAEPQEEVMPEKFHAYYKKHLDMKSPDSLWKQFRGALIRHTQLWQKVLLQCGLTP